MPEYVFKLGVIMNQHNINLQVLQEIANKGVRRSALFMGLGVNAARSPDLKHYELSGITGLDLIPAGVDAETLKEFKEEFERWVVGCGLREMIETFSVFLDETYNVCRLFSEEGNTVTGELAKRIESDNKKFKSYGIKLKMKFLYDGYQVGVKEQTYLTSINQARNCLTHRRGIVGTEDCIEGQELVVKWQGLDIWAETAANERIPMELPFKNPMILEAGGKIKAGRVERIRKCPIGAVVKFTPKELAEIGLTMLDMAHEITSGVEQYGKNVGIAFEKRKNPNA
jgi:hypothetical protein